MIDPRTPVVVGVGEVEQRVGPEEAREPLLLFADAVRAADADTGTSLLARVDTVAAVQIVSWPYGDAGARVSELLDALKAQEAARASQAPPSENSQPKEE